MSRSRQIEQDLSYLFLNSHITLVALLKYTLSPPLVYKLDIYLFFCFIWNIRSRKSRFLIVRDGWFWLISQKDPPPPPPSSPIQRKEKKISIRGAFHWFVAIYQNAFKWILTNAKRERERGGIFYLPLALKCTSQ